MISDNTIRRFQQAVRKAYSENLTFEQAKEVLQGWVNYFDLLAKIDARGKQTSEDTTPEQSRTEQRPEKR